MLVKRIIEKEVNCCSGCPYFFEDNDMGAIHCNCLKKVDLGFHGYDLILKDITWQNSNEKISDECPLKKEVK